MYGYTDNYLRVKTYWNPELAQKTKTFCLSGICDDGCYIRRTAAPPMPLIFLEYGQLCSEREFSNFWQFVSEGQLNDGIVNEHASSKSEKVCLWGWLDLSLKTVFKSWRYTVLPMKKAVTSSRSARASD